QGLGASGAETKRGVSIWNNGTPKALPPNVFLICGDRAWQRLPKNVFGDPCYLGKLTLMAPNREWLTNLTKLSRRSRRAVTGLPLDCDDKVSLLSATERVFLSLFVLGAAAGDALNQLGKLACWAEKQANVTREIIEHLLQVQDSLRHAVLQNKAAIDFLLLAQGHGCDDFEGMCCMNLSDHSESNHKKVKWLKDHVNKIQQDVGFFGLDSLADWFGIGGWLKGLFKTGILILIIVFGLLLVVPCLFS
ncbi:SYNA protein, partial [Chloroceryle aenea]|nr:SYNA protein [Chloroceryle aenea]